MRNNKRKCCVPNCVSLDKFYSIPSSYANGVKEKDPLRARRRWEWLKAVQRISDKAPEPLYVCSLHFVKGRPAPPNAINDEDWIPSLALPSKHQEQTFSERVQHVIQSLPEVEEEFDAPEYVFLQEKLSAKRIERNLLKSSISYPICDSNGAYSNDHDYLGLPIAPHKTLLAPEDYEHDYPINKAPACLDFNSMHFCNICGNNFENLFIFNKHLSVHVLTNKVTCCFCKKTFLTTACLNTHLNVHTEKCKDCARDVPLVQYKFHKILNKAQKQPPDVPDSRKIFFCIFCMLTFTNERDYRLHLQEKHRRRVKRVKK